tara:strand:- start:123 stop:227 length:105 start_codon:yes stop_codon:yes gene_type:complete
MEKKDVKQSWKEWLEDSGCNNVEEELESILTSGV